MNPQSLLYMSADMLAQAQRNEAEAHPMAESHERHIAAPLVLVVLMCGLLAALLPA